MKQHELHQISRALVQAGWSADGKVQWGDTVQGWLDHLNTRRALTDEDRVALRLLEEAKRDGLANDDVPRELVDADTERRWYRSGFAAQLAVICFFLCVFTVKGADFDAFTKAIHQVETGGKLGAIVGDQGKALGPLQIHRVCWMDANMPTGSYQDCKDLGYSKQVLRRYLERYASSALQTRDWQTCARTWNGGPRGAQKKATEAYWLKVKKHL